MVLETPLSGHLRCLNHIHLLLTLDETHNDQQSTGYVVLEQNKDLMAIVVMVVDVGVFPKGCSALGPDSLVVSLRSYRLHGSFEGWVWWVAWHQVVDRRRKGSDDGFRASYDETRSNIEEDL